MNSKNNLAFMGEQDHNSDQCYFDPSILKFLDEDFSNLKLDDITSDLLVKPKNRQSQVYLQDLISVSYPT